MQPARPGSGRPEESGRVPPTLQPVSSAGLRERACEGVWGAGLRPDPVPPCPRALPAPRRLTCDDCLANSSQCAWCQSTRTCFLFAAYLARYPHGGCRGWDDRCGRAAGARKGRVEVGRGGGSSGGLTPASPQRTLGASVPEL